MLSLRDRWQGFRHGRASTDAIAFHAGMAAHFGPGIGNQPAHNTLLQENTGVADMATRAIASRLSTLNPLVKVRRRERSGTVVEEILDDHPLKLLLNRPHPNLSWQQIARLTGQYIVTVGEAYWLKVGNGLGLPVELHPIPPGNIEPALSGGIVSHYVVTSGDGRRKDLPTDTVVRVYFPDPENPHGSEGYLGPAGLVADTLKFSKQTVRAHYQGDATPKTALKPGADSPGFADPDERDRFLHQWNQRHHRRSGTESGSPAILPTGWDLIQLSMQSGAEMVPLLEFFRDEQLMGFGTPRSILGQVVSGDRSSAETNQYVFDRHTVLPIAMLFQDAITHQIAHDFDPAIFVEFEEFVSDDKAFRLAEEQSDLTNKVRSVNQVREDRGLDPSEWGELPVGQLGQVPYDGDDDFSLSVDDGNALEDEDRARSRADRAAFFTPTAEWQRQLHRERKFVPAFLKAMRQIFRAQMESVLGRLEDAEPRSRVSAAELFEPDEWESLFKRRVDPVRERAFKEILGETLSGLGQDEFVFTDEMRKFLKDEGGRLVKQTGVTTQRRIGEALQVSTAEGEGVGQAAARIREVFNERRRNHARTIARTETLKASQQAQVAGFETSGVVESKQWNTSLDGVVRDSHAATEGQKVGVRDSFTLGDGEAASAPGLGAGGGQLSAGNTINCRCFVTPVLED